MILFDLDGTLIDSIKGIYDCYILAMSELKVEPVSKIEFRSNIGASFDKMIGKLHKDITKDNLAVQKAISVFRQNYDTTGYRSYKVYEGIEELLRYLHESGFKIGVVSNKKNYQVEQILKKEFGKIQISPYGKISDPEWTKKCQTKKINNLHKVIAFTGDTEEDRECATAVNATFIYAEYGYGIVNDVDNNCKCNDTLKLLEVLQQKVL